MGGKLLIAGALLAAGVACGYASVLVDHFGYPDAAWSVYTPMPFLSVLSLGLSLAGIAEFLLLMMGNRGK